MFGDAARRAAGLGTFVPARALIAIHAFPCMEPMALMAAQGIGRLIRPAVGEIGGNGNGTGGCAQEIGRLPSVSCALDGELDLLTLLGTLPSEGKGQRFESPRARQ